MALESSLPDLKSVRAPSFLAVLAWWDIAKSLTKIWSMASLHYTEVSNLDPFGMEIPSTVPNNRTVWRYCAPLCFRPRKKLLSLVLTMI